MATDIALGGGVVLLQEIRRVIPVLGESADLPTAFGETVESAKTAIIDKAKTALGVATYEEVKQVPEDDPACKSDGVTNKGIVNSARWKAILNGAILAVNTATSLKMAKLERDLGERYLKLAEEQRKYYNERYKPLEESLTKEALALPKYVRDKEQMNTGQMVMSARMQTAGALDKAITCTGRYCTGQRASLITDQLLTQATTESVVAGLAHRYTDREEITHNNLRWEKREQVLKIGRDIPTQAVSYASLATGIFGSIGRQASKGAEGAMGFLAYRRGETVYPEQLQPVTYSTYVYDNTVLKQYEVPQRKTYTTNKVLFKVSQ